MAKRMMVGEENLTNIGSLVWFTVTCRAACSVLPACHHYRHGRSFICTRYGSLLHDDEDSTRNTDVESLNPTDHPSNPPRVERNTIFNESHIDNESRHLRQLKG